MKKNITAAFVASAKAPAQGQIDYWDTKLKGFGLRVSQGGRRTWIAMYRHQGRLRRYTIGTYPPLTLADAREMARDKLADVQKGVDVAEVKQAGRDADSFGDLVKRYMTEYATPKNRPGTVRDKRNMLAADVLPRWEHRQAASITRREVIELVNAIAARGAPIRANRIAALMSSIFAFALDQEILQTSPGLRIPRPGAEQARDRVLSADDIRAIWRALDDEGAAVAGIFKLALLTAQRKSEISGMYWSELDLDQGWWTLPKERTKADRAHRVPLVPEAVAILQAIQDGPHDPVFVFRGGRIGKPINNLGKALRRVRKRSGVAFWLHDLRRTAASIMASLGVAQLVIGRTLNHADGSVTAKHYALYQYDHEKRDGLLRLETRLLAVINDGEQQISNVIELRA
jgi:integrase